MRAVCHRHEIDQLNGLFWIQRLSRLKRERLMRRFTALPTTRATGMPGSRSA
jgi:peptide deformylase